MDAMKYFMIVLCIITILMILFFAIKSRRFFKIIFLNAFLGIGAIILINLTKKYTGVYIPINYWTVSTGGIFGLPAVLGLLICNFIFI